MEQVKVMCDYCKGRGKVPYKLADGICFRCDGKGFHLTDKSNIETPSEKTYIHFVKGNIKEVVKSFEVIEPENPTRYRAEQFEIDGNTVYYHKKFNRIRNSQVLYSATFEHTTIENTIHILARLYKCYLKESKLKLYEMENDQEQINNVLQQIENAEKVVIEMLSNWRV